MKSLEFTWKFLYDVPQFERVFIDISFLTADNEDTMSNILKYSSKAIPEKKPEKLTFRVNFSKAKTDLRELLEVEDYVMLRDVEASEEKKHPIAFYVLFTGKDAEKFYSILDLKSKLPKKLMEQVGVHFVVDKMKSLPRGEIEYLHIIVSHKFSCFRNFLTIIFVIPLTRNVCVFFRSIRSDKYKKSVLINISRQNLGVVNNHLAKSNN